jgi:hypothetical protein
MLPRRWFLVGTIASLALCLSPSASAQSTPLRYDWQPEQNFAYRVKITVDTPTKTETYQGTIHYTVQAADDDSRSVTYQGGLKQATRWKESAGSRGPGPRFGPPRIPVPSPFSRSSFRGIEQVTNEITLAPSGEVKQLKGDSQLPYLLGNLSLLPFEPLPPPGQREWEVHSDASITEKEDNNRPFPRFGAFDPFGRGQQDEQVQSASESASYSVTSVNDELITVAKTYELKSPAPRADETGFTFSGRGTWLFNRKLHLSESLHMDLKLVVVAENQQTTLPIQLEYQRLGDEELAEIRAERERQQAELRRKAEEQAQAQAEAKRRAEAPLTADERTAVLASLRTADAAALSRTLSELAAKSPQHPDRQIAAAIEPHLAHSERSLREAAHQALLKWSLEYRPRGELDQKYSRPSPVPSTARVVTADTPLYVGQILQFQDHTFWKPAEVLELLPDGQVKIHPRGWPTAVWDKAVPRDKLQLAPEELFQPAKSPTPVAQAGLRTWSDVTGTYQIQATYLGVADGQVQLERQDGKQLQVPLEKLSPQDRDFVQQAQEAAQKPENPFE